MKSTNIFSLLTFLSTVAAISLSKREDGQSRVVHFDLQRNQIRDRAAHDAQRLRWRRDGSVNAEIENQLTLYALNISLGTPEQKFTVNIDTGSSDLWVNSGKSNLCSLRSDPCSTSGTYTANSSSTYNYVNSIFNITYAGGNGASGDYVTDTIRFAGQTVKNLQFGVGYESTTPLAILGIGYPLNEAQSSNAGLKPYQNLPAMMAANDMIASNAYSIYLNDLNSNTGNLLFGGVDRAQYTGDLITVPVQTTGGVHAEFFVTLTQVELDGSSLSNGDVALAALLDTGTSLTYLPNAMTGAVYEAVGASFDERAGTGIVSCDLAKQKANMTFHFSNSLSIDVPMSELVLSNLASSGSQDANDNNACQFGIAPAGADGTVILGDTFLRSAYVVFDIANNEISLAQSKFNVKHSDIAEIGSGSDAVPSAATASSDVTATSGLPASATATETGGGDNAGVVRTPPMLGMSVTVALATLTGFFGFFL